MLKIPTPFPEVGSWALLEKLPDHSIGTGQGLPGSRLFAVRVTRRDDDLVTVSLAGEYAASGFMRVRLDQLLNADPLSVEEKAELTEIEQRMVGKARPKKADVARWKVLGSREERALALRLLLEKQPEKHFPAAAAAARERKAVA